MKTAQGKKPIWQLHDIPEEKDQCVAKACREKHERSPGGCHGSDALLYDTGTVHGAFVKTYRTLQYKEQDLMYANF